MDPNGITPEEFMALPEEQRMAILQGVEPEQETPEVPEGEGQGVTVPQPQPEAEQVLMEQEQPEPQAEPQHRGDPTVALRQERERRRQLEEMANQQAQQLQQMQAILQDPQALQQYMAQFGPQEAPETIEDPETLNYYIQQATAPLQQQMQQMQQLLAQSEHEKQMMQLKQQFPDIDTTVAEFDNARPDLAGHYGPVDKHLMIQGMRAADPTYQQQTIQAEAQKIAEKMVAEKLASMGAKENPVTLSGVIPGKGNDGPDIDLSTITPEQWSSLDQKTRDKLLQGG